MESREKARAIQTLLCRKDYREDRWVLNNFGGEIMHIFALGEFIDENFDAEGKWIGKSPLSLNHL